MTPLERRYRRVLRVLPPTYLAVRGEEMVDTFLLSMRTEDPAADALVEVAGHPSWAEQLSIVRLAVGLRCGGRHAPPRYEVLGGAVRWCMAAVVLVQAVSAVQLLVGYTWLWHAGFWSDDSYLWSSGTLARDVFSMLWLPAFVALAMRRVRSAQVFAGLATTSALAVAFIETRSLASGSSTVDWVVSAWLILVVDIGVVLGLAAFHREAPSLRPRPWLICGAVAVVAYSAFVFVPGVRQWVLVDSFIVWRLGAVLGAAAVLVSGRSWTAARRTQAHLGVALLCAVAVILYAPYVVALAVNGAVSYLPAPYLISIFVQLAVTAAIGVAFAVAGLRHVRRLPRVTYAAPGAVMERVCPRKQP